MTFEDLCFVWFSALLLNTSCVDVFVNLTTKCLCFIFNLFCFSLSRQRSFPSCTPQRASGASRPRPSPSPRRTKPSLEETSFEGRQTEMDGERGANLFRDVNKIKEPDMIKHEVHYKGNVNLSPDPFIIKNTEPSLGGGGTPGEFMRPTSSI